MRPFLSYAIGAAGALSAAAALSITVVGGESMPDTAPRAIGVEAMRAPLSPPPSMNDEAMSPPSQGRGDHAFYFTRGIYSSGGGYGGFRGRGSWATDYPKADIQFLTVLRRLTNLDAYASQNAVTLDDPELRRFPFLYILEVGRISLSPAEVTGLRDYMLSGGFVFVDDFWDYDEWYPFQQQMQLVLPEYPIVDVPMDHEIFRVFYEIREVQQMPSINAWRAGMSTECWGCEVAVRGIFDDAGRLMMLIHWNTDNGDAWEWAEQPDLPLKFSTYAYQIGVNAVVYAMSH